MSYRRVVVTGLGVISPVGNSVQEAWETVCKGKSGISYIDHFDTSDFQTKFAGLVKGFDATVHGIAPKDVKKMDSFIQYGVAAGLQAFAHAGLEVTHKNAHRIGVAVGSGIGGLGLIEQNYNQLLSNGPRRLSPFFIPSTIINMVSGHISIITNAKGPNLSVTTACATGTHAIGLSARLISCGDADMMIAGGSEKSSTPLGIGGFNAAKALSTRNDEPQKASRPWDKDRDGFVLGDGAGVLVLEEYEHAKQRGATIYAELVGFGMSGDAYHITAPLNEGQGAALAMCNAIQNAQIALEEIGYINAHGTSTLLGDLAEIRAIKQVFKEHAYSLKISSTKSMTGHLLGAAGAIEAIFTILALHDQQVPPTINLDQPDEGCDLNLVPHQAQATNVEYALSNSFGFGGTNGSLVFKRYRAE